MEFLTLHELSVQFDFPVRGMRYRLRQLVLAGKLIEGEDYRRDHYVDETHFVWRINPLSFMRITGLQPVTKPATKVSPPASKTVNQSAPLAADPAPQGYQTLPKVDTGTPGMEREMIDFLKNQVRVKDGQIADLSEQNKTGHSLNLKLTAQIVQQADKIQDLLRLTGGKSEVSEFVSKPVNESVTTDTKFGNKTATRGEQREVEPSTVESREAA